MGVGPVKADDNLVQIGDVLQFQYDAFQRISFEFGKQRRQDKAQSSGPAKLIQFLFNNLNRPPG